MDAKEHRGYADRIAANLEIVNTRGYPQSSRTAAYRRALRGMTALAKAGYGYPLFRFVKA